MIPETDAKILTGAPAQDGAEGGNAVVSDDSVSRNLYGQRLGRKGRDTRDRIVAAANTLLSRPDNNPITLSSVAREASLGMTTLYLYFNDLTELLLAVMEPMMVNAEEAYLARARERWPDETLGAQCFDFMLAYNDFWSRHARILHLRNALADQQNRGMMLHRVAAATTLIDLVVMQMDGDPLETQSASADMATVLMTGVERAVTMSTGTDMMDIVTRTRPKAGQRVIAIARLMELAIRDRRSNEAGLAGA